MDVLSDFGVPEAHPGLLWNILTGARIALFSHSSSSWSCRRNVWAQIAPNAPDKVAASRGFQDSVLLVRDAAQQNDRRIGVDLRLAEAGDQHGRGRRLLYSVRVCASG